MKLLPVQHKISPFSPTSILFSSSLIRIASLANSGPMAPLFPQVLATCALIVKFLYVLDLLSTAWPISIVPGRKREASLFQRPGNKGILNSLFRGMTSSRIQPTLRPSHLTLLLIENIHHPNTSPRLPFSHFPFCDCTQTSPNLFTVTQSSFSFPHHLSIGTHRQNNQLYHATRT